MAPAETILNVINLKKHFGGVCALNGVDLDVRPGETVGLIGPNGSGKTTLFDCITGELRPDEGKVMFRDAKINGLPPYRIARVGIQRTSQHIETLPRLSVLDNLLFGGQQRQGERWWGSLFRSKHVKSLEMKLIEEALEMSHLVGLARHAHDRAGDLSYGQQKLLAIGMVLMARPKIILLDEPTAGVNPRAIDEMVQQIRMLQNQGYTFVLVEHRIPVVMELCDRVVVLNSGRKISEGTPVEVQRDPVVLDAYFGRA